jgi:hypothetical protein
MPERLLNGSIRVMDAMRGGLSWRWRSLLGRVAGSGLAGAALGAAVAVIWNASWTSDFGCPRPPPGNVDSSFCLPVGLWLLAIVVNCVVITAGVWGTFTLLRMLPRTATVPWGCVLMVVMIFVSTGERGPGVIKSPPTPWLTALEAGAGLAAFALIAEDRRVSGVLALAVTIVAALAVPPLVRQHEQADARLNDLAALGFPLEVPSLPGYHAIRASATDGSLLITMDQSIPYPGTTEILVEIAPAGGTYGARELAMCAGPGRSKPLYDACTSRGPHRWLLTNTDPLLGDAALAESAGLVVESDTSGHPTQVSDSTLIAAVTSLRPASAASLAGLGG